MVSYSYRVDQLSICLQTYSREMEMPVRYLKAGLQGTAFQPISNSSSATSFGFELQSLFGEVR